MHKGHRTLIMALRTLDLLRNMALYTWHCRIRVSATSVWEGLRLVIVALPGLFFYLFFYSFQDNDLKLAAK